MVGAKPPIRLAAVLGLSTCLFIGTATVFAPAAMADESTDSAVAAARWQAGEVADGAIPGMGGNPDWGLTIDTLIALEATGADKTVTDDVTASLQTHVRDYNSLDAWGEPGQRIAGATAKLLYAAVITGSQDGTFGEYDLRTETLDLVAGGDTGLEHGRVKDKVNAPATDNSNTFGQSLAVLGLARSGGVPDEVVDFLIDQQCEAGGLRLYPYAFGGGTVTGDCDDQGASAVLDPDSTAMAVQALFAAAQYSDTPGAEAAANQGADWLKEIQKDDGSFGGSGPTAAANTNSTGLAGQALAAAGHQTEADQAAAWVRDHQLTEANAGAASKETGALAYNADSLASAQSDGIPDMQRDQWRRATPQALLTLAQVSLGDIGTFEPDPPGPDPQNPGESDPDGKADGDNGGGPGGDQARGMLPVTGDPVLPFAGIGTALLLSGFALLRLAHRKETRS